MPPPSSAKSKVFWLLQTTKRLPKGQGWGFAVHRSFTGYVAVANRVSVRGKKLKVEEMHLAADCGQVVNPDRVRSQMEGAMIFGLSLCLYAQIDFQQGRVMQSNFHDMPLLRHADCPPLHVHLLQSDQPPCGVGETGVPPVAPSICNAIFAASGLRIRDLLVKGHLEV